MTGWIWAAARHEDRVTYARQALVGVMALLVIGLIGGRDVPLVAVGVALLAVWLIVSALTTYLAACGAPGAIRGPRSIPLRFSGPTGRFAIRRRADGRDVQVVGSTGNLVAEVRATDDGDQIDLLLEPSTKQELVEFGTALGQAIELASDADAAHEDWDDHGVREAEAPGGREANTW